MAALVALGEPAWTVSDVELGREGPSYSYDTLTALGASGWQPTQIFFVIGADAFADIATWSRYPAVLDLAHFAVVTRPGTTLDDVRTRVPALAERLTTTDAVSSRATPGIVLVTATTPDVSSTDIRARAARGDSLAGLVPEPVEQYIRRHGLYA
jgi:nicotinate-nucleotide adenylyltransferase